MSGRRKKAAPAPAAEAITSYKGFDADLSCRGFQYAVGATYTHDGAVVRCTEGGFHSCEMPLDVWGYYGPATSRFASTEATGQVDRGGDDSKIASGSITIKAELRLPDFIRRAVAWICHAAEGNGGLTSGDRAHAASTGDGAHAASTGNRAHAASTGDYAHAASTGDGAISASIGYGGMAKAGSSGAIVLANYADDGSILHIRASKVGESGVEAGKWYALDESGEFVEVQP